jgi:hypothetical protein
VAALSPARSCRSWRFRAAQLALTLAFGAAGACNGSSPPALPPGAGPTDAAALDSDRAPSPDSTPGPATAPAMSPPVVDAAPPRGSEPPPRDVDAAVLDTPIADTAPFIPGAPGPSPSEELYDPEVVPRFDIELDDAARAALALDPRSYVHGRFKYGNEMLADVGVRLKGEASLRTLDEKPPFKIKFDEYVPNQTFRGLRRMTFNNMVEDPSFVAERLSYEVFRAANLPAPRANSAQVFLNGKPCGVYANVETEDKTFLRRWFASDAGNLYEEGQKDFLPGNDLAFELETNEGKNDRSDLTAFIASIAGARDETLLADLDAQLDTAHFLRFTAMEAVVNQWDMYGYTRFYPNNFRIYRDPAQAKFVFLPWGMDMSLKDFRSMGDHIAIFEPARRYNNPRGPITGGVIFQRCLHSPACTAAYTATLRQMLAVFETLDLGQRAQHHYQQIKALVYADPRKEISNAAFEAGFATVVRIIRERPAKIRAELN